MSELLKLQLNDKETMRRVALLLGKTEEEFETSWAEFVELRTAMEERAGVVPS